VERERDLGRHVTAAGGSGAPPGRTTETTSTLLLEHGAQDVAEVALGEPAPEPGRAATGAREAGRTEATKFVVLLAGVLVADHAVGLADLLEALLGPGVVGVRVGVVLAREPAVRLLDLVLRGVTGHPEHVVVVLLEPF